MTNHFEPVGSRQPMALCQHYCSAYFDEQRVQVLAADGTLRELTVTWAVGALADGEWEPLGAWPKAAVGQAFWRGVWEDLNSRGVNKISLVRAPDLDARALCPTAKVLPPFRRILGSVYVPATSSVGVLRTEARRAVREASGGRSARIALEHLLAEAGAGHGSVLSPDWPELLEQFKPFYALRSGRRASVRMGDEYAEQLSDGLHRAVDRHGAFSDSAVATSFVADALARFERRLGKQDIAVPTVPARFASASTAGQGAVARRF